MALEGYIDAATSTDISGWVFDNGYPTYPLQVEIIADGQVITTLMADLHRPDLEAHGKGNGRHAFAYKLPSGSAISPLAARLVGKRWNLVHAGGQLPVSIRFDRYLAHSLEYGLPSVRGGFSVANPCADETAIVARIVEAYHRAVTDDPHRNEKKSDVWSQLADECHVEVTKLLHRRDIPGLVLYLRDAHAKGLTHGISQGEQTTTVLRQREDARNLILYQHLDKLVSLAEFLGVLDVESPEQHGRWAENLHSDPDTLLGRIHAALGDDLLPPPQVMGFHFGLKTQRGILTGRDIIALYAALRLRSITREAGLNRPAICEIGSGLGLVAYYAARLGIGPYTVIDLPLVNVLQSYFLLRALPQTNICLYGEKPTAETAVTLWPTFCFDRGDRSYDLLLNQDSFPEMHVDFSLAYLRQSLKNVRVGFFSINQEARAPQADGHQSVVRDLVQRAGGYRLVSRFRHWLWAGYVEEWYRTG